MPESFLTPEVMSIVGTTTPGRRGLITANHIAKFCAGIDDANPLYHDEQAARAAGYPGIIAPPLFNSASTRPVPHRSGLLGDGQFDSVAPPGLGHLQTMLAGQSWELLRPSVVGEEVIETFLTKSVTERQGKTGTMVFVEKEATIATVAGETIERYTTTLMLRRPPPPLPPFDGGAAGGAPATAAPAATVPTADGFIKYPDMITLFMFSAAIWAIHRIHWDIPYAQSEGLALPVVPGWMLASYLAQLAETRAPAGQRLSRLTVRYRSSGYPGDALACVATPGPDGTIGLSLTNQHGADVVIGDAGFGPR